MVMVNLTVLLNMMKTFPDIIVVTFWGMRDRHQMEKADELADSLLRIDTTKLIGISIKYKLWN